MRKGIANLPLHYGSAPSWLFDRMVRLAREITIYLVTQFGPEEFLRRMAHPFWFQSLGCLLGFDWHSSGVTTTTCGAIKEGVKGLEKDLGLFVCGGKGGRSRKTPYQIEEYCFKNSLSCGNDLIYASRISAKVDNTALQDGYQLYHHSFFFDRKGHWAVVQQGMNEGSRMARRYHWLSDEVEEFVNEPESAICCDQKGPALNLVAQESEKSRQTIALLAQNRPERNLALIGKIKLSLNLPKRHQILISDLRKEYLSRIFLSTYRRSPENFEKLLMVKGVGPKTIRALSLIAELIYGSKPSYQDPVRYSFAHGGKDGTPYPVNKRTYDQSIEILRQAVRKARVSPFE